MKRVFFYSLWNCERLEKYLSDMELEGFRLDAVHFRYVFSFRKTRPTKAQYIYSYWFIREIELYDSEAALRRNLRAALIPCNRSGGMHMHRTPDAEADLSAFQSIRTEYFKRGLLKRLAFFLLLLVCFSVAMQSSLEFERLLYHLSALISLLAFIYNLIGFVRLVLISNSKYRNPK